MELILKCACYVQATVVAFLADRRGVSTVEYALMVVAIIGAVSIAAGLLSGAFKGLFEDLSDDLTGALTNIT